jgi:hypothetical protein
MTRNYVLARVGLFQLSACAYCGCQPDLPDLCLLNVARALWNQKLGC